MKVKSNKWLNLAYKQGKSHPFSVMEDVLTDDVEIKDGWVLEELESKRRRTNWIKKMNTI